MSNPKLCPDCARRGACINSRWENDFVRRRFACHCGRRWSTVEVVVPDEVSAWGITNWLKANRADPWKQKVAASLRDLLLEVEK